MMPLQSVFLIRLSLLWLLLSTLAGAILLVHKAYGIHPSTWLLLPLHFEMAIWGWMVQLVIGTAYWMFPRFLRSDIRGPELPAWILVILFNSGLVMILSGHLFTSIPGLIFSGRFFLLTGIGIFIYLIWARVISYRNV
ncbi:MAG: hypothetical protein EA359_13080 [Balneolaceae bacterium]|nr:MAG: hypothetical protein EA359_13080 [Balneolaceae bacterium]